MIFECLLGRWTAAGIATGVAFGAMLGLIPPGNLVSLAVLLLLFFSGSNLVFAGLNALFFLLLARWIAPWADRIGEAVLTLPVVQRFGSRAWEYPLVAWTDLDNTVVLGQTLIGLVLFLPLLLLVWGVLRAGRKSSKSEAAS